MNRHSVNRASGRRLASFGAAVATIAMLTPGALAQEVTDIDGWSDFDGGDIPLIPEIPTSYSLSVEKDNTLTSAIDAGLAVNDVVWPNRFQGRDTIGEDDWTQGIPFSICGFDDFPFFGREFDKLFISANGRFSFRDPGRPTQSLESGQLNINDGAAIPSLRRDLPELADALDYTAALYWTNLTAGTTQNAGVANPFGSRVVYRCEADALLVEFYRAGHIDTKTEGVCSDTATDPNATGGHITAQALFKSDGVIELRYVELDFADFFTPEPAAGGGPQPGCGDLGAFCFPGLPNAVPCCNPGLRCQTEFAPADTAGQCIPDAGGGGGGGVLPPRGCDDGTQHREPAAVLDNEGEVIECANSNDCSAGQACDPGLGVCAPSCDDTQPLASCAPGSICGFSSVDVLRNHPRCERNIRSFAGRTIIGIRGRLPAGAVGPDPSWVIDAEFDTPQNGGITAENLLPRLENQTVLRFTPAVEVVKVEHEAKCAATDLGTGIGNFAPIGLGTSGDFRITWDTTDPVFITNDECFVQAKACSSDVDCGSFFIDGPIRINNNFPPEVTDIAGYDEAGRNTGLVTFTAETRDEDESIFEPAIVSSGSHPGEFDGTHIFPGNADLTADGTAFETGGTSDTDDELFRIFFGRPTLQRGPDELRMEMEFGEETYPFGDTDVTTFVDYLDGPNDNEGQVFRMRIEPGDQVFSGSDFTFGGLLDTNEGTVAEGTVERDFDGDGVADEGIRYLVISDGGNDRPDIVLMVVPGQAPDINRVGYEFLEASSQVIAGITGTVLPITIYMGATTGNAADLADFMAADLELGDPPPGVLVTEVEFVLKCDGVNVCADGTDDDGSDGFTFDVNIDDLGVVSDNAEICARANDGLRNGEFYCESGIQLGDDTGQATEPLVADAGGPYATPVGGDVDVDGCASEPGTGGAITSYSWTSDGVELLETSDCAATIPWANVAALCGRSCRPGQVFALDLTVTNASGDDTAATTLSLVDAAVRDAVEVAIAPADCLPNPEPPACDTSMLPANRNTITVGPMPMNDFSEIRLAVDSLPAALDTPTVIEVWAGTYAERVRLVGEAVFPNERLWIMARCQAGVRDEVVVDGSTLSEDASLLHGLQILSRDNVVVDGLKFTGHEGDGVRVQNSHGVMLRALTAYGNDTAGIRLEGSDDARLAHNTAYGNDSFGIIVRDSFRATLTANNAFSNEDSGTILWAVRTPRSWAHESVNNGESDAQNLTHGLSIAFGSDRALIRDSAFCGNGSMGILVRGSKAVQLSGNRVEGNTIHNIALHDGSDDAMIRCNVLRFSNEFGVHVRGSDNARVMHNWSSDNDKGIVATGGSSGATVHNNMVRDNANAGITASWGSSDMVVTNNSSMYNGANGVELFGDSGRATIVDNIIVGHDRFGMFTDDESSSGTLLDYNVWHGNNEDARGTDMGAAAISEDPGFVDQDGHDGLRGDSPARNSGHRTAAEAGLESGAGDRGRNGTYADGSAQVNRGYHFGMCE